MSTREKIDAVSRKLGDIGDVLIYFMGCGGLLFGVGLSMANVLSWWFLGRRLGVTDELSLIGLVWLSYVGMGLLYRNNGHCVMDFVIKALPPKARVFMRIFTDIILVVVSVFAVYYSWKLAVKSFAKKLILTRIPYFYCDICITIGYAHLLLLALADIVRNVMILIHWDEYKGKGDIAC